MTPKLPSGAATWRSLNALAQKILDRSKDKPRPGAAARRIAACGIEIDSSRQLLSPETLEQLHLLARERQVEKVRDAMFAGEIVNRSEQRAALHSALRADDPGDLGAKIGDQVRRTRARMQSLAEALHAGTLKGSSGAPLTDIVNIGIGGSDFGSRLLCDALRDRAAAHLRVHFIASVDGVQIDRLKRQIDPGRTLFVVSSKSFGTVETLLNAKTLLHWFRGSSLDVARHWYAVTGNAAKAQALGIPADNVLDVPDWVGGRFSAWGAVGLPAALYLGRPLFSEWLAGGAAMDEHHRTAPLEANLPVHLALLNVWNSTFLQFPSHCIASYDNRLAEFLTWAQQLEMESNGKSTSDDGQPLDYATAPVVWGGLGNSGQHTYYQLLREGTVSNAITLITVDSASAMLPDHAAALAAQAEAQTEALVARDGHAARNGLTRLRLRDLEPATLGALMACFEHATTTAAWIWGINPFDQPGVELGKKLAQAKVNLS
jgi:glucose-6-phosphate isomerase